MMINIKVIGLCLNDYSRISFYMHVNAEAA